MPVVIVSIATVFVMLVQGYRFNPNNNQVFQAGLVQFGSRPTGATVTVDGAELANRTNTRINVRSGLRTIAMQREGYVSWQKSVTVQPGRVLWLNYVRLVPETITTEAVYSYDTVASSLVHRSQHLYGVQPNRAQPTWETIATTDEFRRTSATIPSSVYTARKNLTFRALEWSRSDRYILFDARSGNNREWLILDRSSPSDSINISKLTSLSISSVSFAKQDDRWLYLVSDKKLYRYDRRNNTLSSALAQNVVWYEQSAEGVVVFRSERGDDVSVGYVSPNASTSKIVSVPGSSNPDDVKYILYDREHYMALLEDNKLVIWRVTLPSSDSNDTSQYTPIATLPVPATVKQLTSPGDTQFIVAHGKNEMIGYDLDQKRSFESLLKDSDQPVWIDGHHVIDSTDGTLVLRDYDGSNNRPIVGNVPANSPAVFSSNNRYLYTMRETADGLELVRSQLIL